MLDNSLPTLFIAVLLFALVWSGLKAIREYSIRRRLATNGIVANAEIIRRRSIGYFSFVDYNFQTEALKVFSGSQEIGPFHRIREGEQVKIVYLPTEPHISRLTTDHADNVERNRSTLIWGVVIITFMIMIINSIVRR